MAAKNRALTTKDHVAIGRLHGSEDIAREASEASARWARDVAVLAEYGMGRAALEAFEAVRAEHATQRVARPAAIAAKQLTVKEKKARLAAAWSWVDKVESILGSMGRGDQSVASRLNAAMPADDASLEAAIGALAELLGEVKARAPEDAAVETRLGEVAELRTALQSMAGQVSTAKAATVAETVEIDKLDGMLVVAIRDLNKAGRKAIRNGALTAAASEYRYHYLNGSQASAANEKSAPGTTVTGA